MFIAALFTTAKMWKQPECPSMGKQRNDSIYRTPFLMYMPLNRRK